MEQNKKNCACNKPCGCKDSFKEMSYEMTDCSNVNPCLFYHYLQCIIANSEYQGSNFSFTEGDTLLEIITLIDNSISTNLLYPIVESVTNYTITGDDLNALVKLDASVPGAIIVEEDSVLNLPVGFNVKITRWGTGTLLINMQGAATLVTSIVNPFDAQYDTHELIKVGPDEWLLI